MSQLLLFKIIERMIILSVSVRIRGVKGRFNLLHAKKKKKKKKDHLNIPNQPPK